MNRNLLNLLGMVGLAAGLFTAAPAHATFGKRSDSNSEEGSKKQKKVKKSSALTSTRGHGASAVGSSSRGSGSSGAVYVEARPQVVVRPWYAYGRRRTVVVDHVHHDYPDQRDVDSGDGEDPFAIYRLELGGTLQPLVGGGMFGLNLLVDWKKLGVDFRYDDIGIEAGDGYMDHVRLFNATATFPLIRGESSRLRAHIGAFSAFAPDAAFIGPGGGLSASIDLLGPFTVEGSAQMVLFPFTELDTRAAMGLRLGPIEGRLGWRFLVLDDQGRVDYGYRNVDVVTGPYLGALFRI